MLIRASIFRVHRGMLNIECTWSFGVIPSLLCLSGLLCVCAEEDIWILHLTRRSARWDFCKPLHHRQHFTARILKCPSLSWMSFLIPLPPQNSCLSCWRSCGEEALWVWVWLLPSCSCMPAPVLSCTPQPTASRSSTHVMNIQCCYKWLILMLNFVSLVLLSSSWGERLLTLAQSAAIVFLIVHYRGKTMKGIWMWRELAYFDCSFPTHRFSWYVSAALL